MALEAVNTQTSLTKADDSWAKGKRSKRPRSGDSPPQPSSSSPYGPPPNTEEEYLAFCLILLAHGSAAAAEEEGPVVQSSAEKEPEVPSSSAEAAPVEAMPVTVVAPEVETSSAGAPVEAKPVSVVPAAGTGGTYTCLECGRGFSSYQALGGHKASHRKGSADAGEKDKPSASTSGIHAAGDGKAHKCGICHMVFSSGQALGGHKRRHFEGKIGGGNRGNKNVGGEKAALSSEAGSRSRSEGSTKSAGAGESSSSHAGEVKLFDLNLPAEMIPEEDDLLCRETAEEVLSPVLLPAAKRPKLLSFDVLFPK